MRVILRVSPFAPVAATVDFTRRCEEAGFFGVGYLDSQMINRDVFVTLAAAAGATRRLHLITAVTNPVTRHVSTIASAAASVDDLAPGRVAVWLGRGYSSVNLAGLREATTRDLGDATRDLRRLLAGDWDVFPGVHSRMRIGPRDVPVYLAAQGPRTIRLAGEVADGLLLAGSLNRTGWDNARRLSEEGARRAGRDPSEIDLCLSVLTCIRASREEAVRWAGPLIVPRLDDAAWLREAGIEAHGVKTPAGLSSLYPDPMHAENHEISMEIAAAVPLELRLQIAEKLGLIGTPADCVARLREIAGAGFGGIFMRTVDTAGFPEAELAAFRAEVGPAVASLP